MKGKKNNKKNETNKKPRHRIHSVEKHYYSIWVDLELMAKMRVYSKKIGRPISEIVVENMENIVKNTKLTPEAKEWMNLRRSLNENRNA